MDGAKIPDQLSKLISLLHQVAYESHENAISAVFSHDVSVAESVGSEREQVKTLFNKIEMAVRDLPAEKRRHLLALLLR